jgi:hypothetical protein
MNINHHIDSINFRDYGVFVSSSTGIISKPKLKKPVTVEWETYHGNVVDLDNKFYEARNIELECFIMADDKSDFIKKCNTFLRLFDKKGTRRLSVSVDGSEPLLFEVYSQEEIEVKKKWTENKMVGTFQLKLTEPEPMKRVYKYTRTSNSDRTCNMYIQSVKMVNVYWGDGKKTLDVCNQEQDYYLWYQVSQLQVFNFQVGQVFKLTGVSSGEFWEEWYRCIQDYAYNPTTDPIDLSDAEYFEQIFPGSLEHEYLITNGTFYIVITGDIDSITGITTNATLVWNKL